MFADIGDEPIHNEKEILIDSDFHNGQSIPYNHDLTFRDQLIEDRQVAIVTLYRTHGDLGLGLVDGTVSKIMYCIHHIIN